MGSRLKLLAVFVFAAQQLGCASVTIKTPANNSTVTTTPQSLEVTVQGLIEPITVTLDGIDLSHFNNQNWQFAPQGIMFYVEPGQQHTLGVSSRAIKGSYSVSDASRFTVVNSPLWYSCPVGKAHAFTGQCCDNGVCDVRAFTNFGPAVYQSFCANSPASQVNDCINQNAQALCGANGAGCANIAGMATQMVAVAFSPGQSGALAHIQAPIGWRNGANAFQAWVTADNAGRPGAPLEAFPLNSLRQQPFPTVSPVHIFSATHPPLTAGTTYWLVIGPTAGSAVGSWNFSLTDTPAMANYLVNSTAGANGVPSLNGPWAAASSPLRPAFEIAVR